MFDHSVYIIGSYAAAAIILTWCALAPVIRTRRARQRLAREASRRPKGDRT